MSSKIRDFCILCGDDSHVYIGNAIHFIRKTISKKRIIPGLIISKVIGRYLQEENPSHSNVICMSCAYHLRRVKESFMFPLDMYLNELMTLSSMLDDPSSSRKIKDRSRIIDARCRIRLHDALCKNNNPYFHCLPSVLQTIIKSQDRVRVWWKLNLFTKFFTSADTVFALRQHRLHRLSKFVGE
jgi:hypothetical protein